MPVETAADLASFFDEDEFSEAASYLAPGVGATAVDCVVIVDRGQGRMPFNGGEQRLAASERHIWVRRSDLASVARNGSFTVADPDGGAPEVLRVPDLPKLDHTGSLWSVQVVKEG